MFVSTTSRKGYWLSATTHRTSSLIGSENELPPFFDGLPPSHVTPEFSQERSQACARLSVGPTNRNQQILRTTGLALDLIWNVPMKQGTAARVSPCKLSIADAFARESPQPLVGSKENLPYYGPPTDRNLRLPVGCSCYADERRSIVCNNHVLLSNLRDLPQQRSQTT